MDLMDEIKTRPFIRDPECNLCHSQQYIEGVLCISI